MELETGWKLDEDGAKWSFDIKTHYEFGYLMTAKELALNFTSRI